MKTMAKHRIPKPNAAADTKVRKPYLPTSGNKILFSFEILDRNEYFDIGYNCVEWLGDLLETMRQVSALPKADLFSGKLKTYRFHNHENAAPPCRVPNGIELKDMHQIRIATSKGGIHGVFVDDVFYVVWLDPMHNLYPDEHHGGLTKITPFKNRK